MMKFKMNKILLQMNQIQILSQQQLFNQVQQIHKQLLLHQQQ